MRIRNPYRQDHCGMLSWVILLAMGVSLYARDAALVVPTSEAPFRGSLVGIDEDWTVSFDVAGSVRRMPIEDLVYWGALEDSGHASFVQLRPAGRLVGRLMDVREDDVVVTSELWSTVTLPRWRVGGLILQPPGDSLDRDKLVHHIHEFSGTRDRFWMANGDELAGTLHATSLDGELPSLFGVDTLRIAFGTGREPTASSVKDVRAAAFARAEGNRATAGPFVVRMGFRDGTFLLVPRLSRVRDHLQLSLSQEVMLAAPTLKVLSQCVMLQPESVRVQFLSDLEPISRAEIPFLEKTWSHGRDRSVVDGDLRAGGRIYPKGLGMHSMSRLVYDVPEPTYQFAAEVALDDTAGEGGSVTFRVFVERNGTWASAAASSIVRGGESPVPLRVDMEGVSRMALVVDYADYADVLDRANWLFARFVTRPSDLSE